MTAAAGPATTERTAATVPAAQASEPAPVPRLADGVELLGEYQDSGYSPPPSLVRRPDGQVIQMSPMLYQVTCLIDGSRDPAAIAQLVSEDLGRTLNADQVRYLVTARLLPLGIVVAEGAPAVSPRANPLLALRARGTLLPEGAANLAGALLRPLFRIPVVIAVVGSVVAIDYWLFADVPDLFARIAPILRSAIPQSLRSPRSPGSPQSPGRRVDPRVSGLRSRARILVTAWVLCVVPLLTFIIGYLLLFLPRINRAMWRAASSQAHLMSAAVAGHRYPMAAVDAAGVTLLALSLAGSLYIVLGLARRLTSAGLRWSAGRPARRLLIAAAGLGCMTALAIFWNLQGQFNGW
jgi:hypothetical protein